MPTPSQKALTELLDPRDEVIEHAARLFDRLIQWRSDPHNAVENMRAAYRYILETTVHDKGLTFQGECPEMEHGWKA